MFVLLKVSHNGFSDVDGVPVLSTRLPTMILIQCTYVVCVCVCGGGGGGGGEGGAKSLYSKLKIIVMPQQKINMNCSY